MGPRHASCAGHDQSTDCKRSHTFISSSAAPRVLPLELSSWITPCVFSYAFPALLDALWDSSTCSSGAYVGWNVARLQHKINVRMMHSKDCRQINVILHREKEGAEEAFTLLIVSAAYAPRPTRNANP